MRHIALFTIASILQILVASEMGRPYISNYLPDEYGAAPQNWAITPGSARGDVLWQY
jgi:hypothetical protein